jgi:glycosyltransferase involved in cell wall biosynthesis
MEPDSITVLPNGYDPQLFFPGEYETRGAEQPLRILVVTRLWADKDPLTMADAFGMLVRDGAALEVTMVGAQGPLRGAVLNRLAGDGVPVRLVDFVSHAELGNLYRGHDVLVQPSLGEGWCQAIVEAFACGLPVITADVPGTREPVGDAGLVFPAKQPQALYHALKSLIDDPRSRFKLRQLGLKRAVEFTWGAIAAETVELYGQILAGLHQRSRSEVVRDLR